MASSSATNQETKKARAARAARRAMSKSDPNLEILGLSTITESLRPIMSSSKKSQQLHHYDGVMHAIRITKYHTSTGMKLYHIVFDNGKDHLVRVTDSEVYSLISPECVQWYEHSLRMSTIKYRVDTTENIPARYQLEIDSSIEFPAFVLPKACRKKSCYICRNERGYLNFSNGEDKIWREKRLLREQKEKEAKERREAKLANEETDDEDSEDDEESDDDIAVEEESTGKQGENV